MRKMIPYGRQFLDKRDIKSVNSVLRSDWLTQGPKVKEFEQALAEYCGAKYCVAVASGTAALHIAAIVSGLKEGNEAVTTPITFLATSNSVAYCGAKPIFADINEDTINISTEEILKCISSRTKAILPVHFAGLPCDMPRISNIAKKHGLTVIEDACHALGAEYYSNNKWIKVGSCKHSDMTILSFHPVKHITTGEGGAILTNSRVFFEKCLIFRNHGMIKNAKMFRKPPQILRDRGAWYYEMQELGFNYRITDIQCALGCSQLHKLDGFIKRRREIADIYTDMFSGMEEVILPIEPKHFRSAWHLFVIQTRTANKRRPLFNFLRNKGIGAQVHYIPVYLQPFYRNKYGYSQGMCPNSEKYYSRAISLPMYPRMKNSDIRYVVNTVKDFYK
jgi:UDP-4-amino-4,6-dideoxy-N-acetyl-beta-L-altrosamine transaminase